jgi:hypothetical protein
MCMNIYMAHKNGVIITQITTYQMSANSIQWYAYIIDCSN